MLQLTKFHRHYKAYVHTTNDATHCCSYFQYFYMVDDVELNHKRQQYILVQNDLNNMQFTSHHNNESCAVAYWLVHKISVSGERHQ